MAEQQYVGEAGERGSVLVGEEVSGTVVVQFGGIRVGCAITVVGAHVEHRVLPLQIVTHRRHRLRAVSAPAQQHMGHRMDHLEGDGHAAAAQAVERDSRLTLRLLLELECLYSAAGLPTHPVEHGL